MLTLRCSVPFGAAILIADLTCTACTILSRTIKKSTDDCPKLLQKTSHPCVENQQAAVY